MKINWLWRVSIEINDEIKNSWKKKHKIIKEKNSWKWKWKEKKWIFQYFDVI